MKQAARLKFELMSRGIRIGRVARAALLASSPVGLTDADYPTTSGLPMVLPGDVYVNAPVDEWYCDRPAAELTWSEGAGSFSAMTSESEISVNVLPLPGYLAEDDPIFDGVRSHVDRVRVSPIAGCTCNCAFCDAHLPPYRLRDRDVLARGLHAAVADTYLPARHALISGGTPRIDDRAELDRIYRHLISASPVPVDVMLMPRESTEVVDMLVQAGVDGLSINLELYDEDAAARLCPQKHRIGHDGYAAAIERAVELTGGAGRVRSMLLVGLEDHEATLAGVEFIASLGADPVLSPFRPGAGTPTADVRPASADVLEDLHAAASEIVQRYGVALGPRCVPCQHNTLTLPSDVPSQHPV